MAIEILLSLHSMDERVIITGANGQIDTELAVPLGVSYHPQWTIRFDLPAINEKMVATLKNKHI